LVGTFAVTASQHQLDNNNNNNANNDNNNNNNNNSTVQFHLHLSISDAKGQVFGGHLVAGTVHTTVELVLGSIEAVRFQRLYDNDTGYNELVVSSSD